MLNLNSPTVQAMLANTPQGYGNMPVYYGNSPTVSSQTNSIPFPSPKEMITQTGQQTIYSPTSFAPRNIIGGYNPGYNAAFSGYNNPYMGYGSYGGYNNYNAPPDIDSKERLEAAMLKGISYDEQLVEESNLYKTISRIVSKNIGRTEEEADKCASTFNIYNKYPKENNEIKKKKIKIRIALKIGDEIISETKESNCDKIDNRTNINFIEYSKQIQKMRKDQIIRQQEIAYNEAPERQFDKTNLLDFLNHGAGVVMSDALLRKLQKQNAGHILQVYNRNGFRERLLQNNGLKNKNQVNAIERFTGRYGIMPDGRPVSPGHDPSIASCFSYNPKTGQYDVTAPNFIRDKLELARDKFIQSINN